MRRSRGEPLPHLAFTERTEFINESPALFAQSVPLTRHVVHRLNRRLRQLTVHGDVELEADHAFAEFCFIRADVLERDFRDRAAMRKRFATGQKGCGGRFKSILCAASSAANSAPGCDLPSRRAFVCFRCSPRSASFQTVTSSFRLAIQRSRSERSRYHARPTRTIGSSPRWTMSRRLVLTDAVFS